MNERWTLRVMNSKGDGVMIDPQTESLTEGSVGGVALG